MLMCRTDAQIIYMVCSGAGDAFITRYWPFLRKAVALKRLRLLVADTKPLRQLADEKVQQAQMVGEEVASVSLRKLYDDFISNVMTKGELSSLRLPNWRLAS
jgi:hypothetical protein